MHREAVAGVGDAAHFDACTTAAQVLLVNVGTFDVMVAMRASPPATAATLRPRLIAIGKAAAAKLR